VKTPSRAAAREILETADDSLLDLVDNLLNRYLRLTALLCAADRIRARGES